MHVWYLSYQIPEMSYKSKDKTLKRYYASPMFVSGS